MNKESMQPNQPNKTKYLIGLLVAILIVCGYLLYPRSPGRESTISNYQKGLHNQTYSKFDSFRLEGAKKGAGASFVKPIEYHLVLKSDKKDQASLSDSLKAPNYAPLGAIHILSVGLNTSVTYDYLQSLNYSFSHPKTDGYKQVLSPIEGFFSARFSPLYDISYSTARPFSSSKIKSGAWAIDINAKPKPVDVISGNENSDLHKTDTSKVQPVPTGVTPKAMEDYKGQIIFAVGKGTYYYFAVYNTTYNWDNNPKAWQKVEGSLKIDQ